MEERRRRDGRLDDRHDKGGDVLADRLEVPAELQACLRRGPRHGLLRHPLRGRRLGRRRGVLRAEGGMARRMALAARRDPEPRHLPEVLQDRAQGGAVPRHDGRRLLGGQQGVPKDRRQSLPLGRDARDRHRGHRWQGDARKREGDDVRRRGEEAPDAQRLVHPARALPMVGADTREDQRDTGQPGALPQARRQGQGRDRRRAQHPGRAREGGGRQRGPLLPRPKGEQAEDARGRRPLLRRPGRPGRARKVRQNGPHDGEGPRGDGDEDLLVDAGGRVAGGVAGLGRAEVVRDGREDERRQPHRQGHHRARLLPPFLRRRRAFRPRGKVALGRREQPALAAGRDLRRRREHHRGEGVRRVAVNHEALRPVADQRRQGLLQGDVHEVDKEKHRMGQRRGRVPLPPRQVRPSAVGGSRPSP